MTDPPISKVDKKVIGKYRITFTVFRETPGTFCPIKKLLSTRDFEDAKACMEANENDIRCANYWITLKLSRIVYKSRWKSVFIKGFSTAHLIKSRTLQ